MICCPACLTEPENRRDADDTEFWVWSCVCERLTIEFLGAADEDGVFRVTGHMWVFRPFLDSREAIISKGSAPVITGRRARPLRIAASKVPQAVERMIRSSIVARVMDS